VLRDAALTSPDQQLPTSVRVKHGISRDGRSLHYYLNYSSEPEAVTYTYASGTDLLTARLLSRGQKTILAPWDVIIVKENIPTQ
jgi:beta-galactosidase